MKLPFDERIKELKEEKIKTENDLARGLIHQVTYHRKMDMLEQRIKEQEYFKKVFVGNFINQPLFGYRK